MQSLPIRLPAAQLMTNLKYCTSIVQLRYFICHGGKMLPHLSYRLGATCLPVRGSFPPFMAALDEGLSDAHEDPQNFQLTAFVAAQSALRASLGEHGGVTPSPVAGNGNDPATVAARSAADHPDLCAQLHAEVPGLSGGAPLKAGSTNKTYEQLYDECDHNNDFAGKLLTMHAGQRRHLHHNSRDAAATLDQPDGQRGCCAAGCSTSERVLAKPRPAVSTPTAGRPPFDQCSAASISARIDYDTPELGGTWATGCARTALGGSTRISAPRHEHRLGEADPQSRGVFST